MLAGSVADIAPPQFTGSAASIPVCQQKLDVAVAVGNRKLHGFEQIAIASSSRNYVADVGTARRIENRFMVKVH